MLQPRRPPLIDLYCETLTPLDLPGTTGTSGQPKNEFSYTIKLWCPFPRLYPLFAQCIRNSLTGKPWFDQGDSQGLACRFRVVTSGRPGKDAMQWPKSSAPSRGNPRLPWRGSLGGASAIATEEPSGRESMRSPRWDVKKSTCAVISTIRSSSLSKAGMKTVPAKSRCARSSGSPWGCSPPSSLPLCGSVMTH